MTALHVLPVGLSLLSSAREESDLRSLRSVLLPGSFDTTTNPDRKVALELARLAGPVTGMLDLHSVLLTEQQREAVRHQDLRLCAEWTSVAVARSRAADTDPAYVLIASDTDDGLRSAILVAGQYGRHVHYVADPLPAASVLIGPGEVYVFRIPGLDLARDRREDETWLSLGAVGHAIQRSALHAEAPCAVTLHLTGGFKAMLPYLLVMAEGIKSVFKNADAAPGLPVPTLHAMSVHEHDAGASLSDLVPVDLPVRWFVGSVLRRLRDLKNDTAGNPCVSGDRWDEWRGQWIEEGGAKLSESGMIVTRTL